MAIGKTGSQERYEGFLPLKSALRECLRYSELRGHSQATLSLSGDLIHRATTA